jgi:hypothetical protein
MEISVAVGNVGMKFVRVWRRSELLRDSER